MEWTSRQVRVKVRDRGPGIDPQFRSRMFEKFSQADASDRRAQGGTGLGLYITRMLVDRMGGRIDVDSVPDQGATFFIEFPIADSPLQGPAPWLLHIDHDLDARRRVTEWLSTLCRVEGAATLEQAQVLLLGAPPPIIIADPQAQGSAEEFCASLRKMAQGRSVVLFTDAVDATFVHSMGVGWLQKAHCGREELMAALRPVIANAGKESQS